MGALEMSADHTLAKPSTLKRAERLPRVPA
jgi:hypothetical protein